MNIVGLFYKQYIFIYIKETKVMIVKEEKLTSVKITQPLFDKFKIAALEDNFSFKKLADRAIFLYLTDIEFREKIHNQINIKIRK